MAYLPIGNYQYLDSQINLDQFNNTINSNCRPTARMTVEDTYIECIVLRFEFDLNNWRFG